MEKAMQEKIEFNSPAEEWSNGLLLGNGHMGCVLYGRTDKEQIDLSEITFFSGEKSIQNNQKDSAKSFQEMRHLVSQGANEKAMEAANGFVGIRQNYGTNLPVGRLDIVFDSEEKDIQDYHRQLDLINGIAEISYLSEKVSYKREAFLSNPANKLLYRISADSKKQIHCSISFDGGANPYSITIEKQHYIFCVKAHEGIHSDGQSGVTLWGCLKIENIGGSVNYSTEGIIIQDADEVVISVELKTDFVEKVMMPEKSEMIKLIKRVEKVDKVEKAKMVELDVMDCVGSFIDDSIHYENLKKEHSKDFSTYMKRVDFSLEEDKMTELMFQYGRYLLLSSSREDSPIPTHLQGIWNDNVACRIGWTCDMHLDINTQMNYWLSESGNLSECHKPLFKWMEEQVIPSGRITAKESYGMPGWSADLVSNAWGFSAPYWSETISPCPTGGIWIASDYWEHYQYTKDDVFLKERAYPVIKEAVDFFLAYIFQEDGDEFYTSGPSISPENCFLIDGKKHYFSNGCTYEILMIRELFSQFLAATKQLGIDNEQVARVDEVFLKLLPYRILKDGSLAEWRHDYPAADPQHRHTSHLLGLFPYSQITPEKTPEFALAAQQSIAFKLAPYENWEDTGWARSMLMLYAARLKDGEAAYRHIKSMQEYLTHPNLLVMHPPTRGAGSFKEVYELDGNTGFSMCVIELLLQSHDGVIQLLPALPKYWKSGSIRGILARGSVMVNLDWKDGSLIKAEFIANKSGTFKAFYKDNRYKFDLLVGEIYTIIINEK